MSLIPSYNVINGTLDSLIIDNDEKCLNWVCGRINFGYPYANDYTEKVEFNKDENSLRIVYPYTSSFDMQLEVYRRPHKGKYIETYTYTNIGEKQAKAEGENAIHAGKDEFGTINIQKRVLGIYTPFNDSYDIATVSLNRRCNAHIWCSGNSSYIYGLRMNGEDSNVGMVVTKGYIDSYGVERKNNSNDRGDFLMYLSDIDLAEKESYVVEFEFFEFIDTADFYKKANEYDNFISFDSEKYTVKVGEKINIKASRAVDSAKCEGEQLELVTSTNRSTISGKFKKAGEKTIKVKYGDNITYIYINVVGDYNKLIDDRINFIIDNQQVNDKDSVYYGAYVLYDNLEDECFVKKGFSNANYNAGRERVGMACTILNRMLHNVEDKEFYEKMSSSVLNAIDFYGKQFVDNSGTVCDEIGYKKYPYKLHRLYNYCWFANMYLLSYEVFKNKTYLDKAVAILNQFYTKGGNKLYAIGLPLVKLYNIATKLKDTELIAQVKSWARLHADTIIEFGENIPKHEVKYEQSIVAPAVMIMLSGYEILGDIKYNENAEIYMKYLMAFNGNQPDFHTNDISIRHWDGFWFGKKRLYGDTFPHYWSTLTAECMAKFDKLSAPAKYVNRINNILTNNLCLFDSDGGGSCAYVYPATGNGKNGGYYDPYSNDQDWALYYLIEYGKVFAD